jgi:hypothetical protein
MIKNFIRWLFEPTQKPIVEEIDLYEKIVELEQRIEKLEEENIETTNLLYELGNSVNAVDARIDIVLNTPKHYENFN